MEPRDGDGDRWIGRVIDGRYEIRARLGAGGMGVVYLAHQASLKRDVAVKLLRPDPAGVNRERFLRETEVASALAHPNIVVVHDCGQTHDGWLYMVMEHLAGRTLKQLVADGGAVPAPRLRAIALQICEALAFAHERDIVHRDLKPSNIMVSKTGDRDTVKVLDFGLAKSLADDAPIVTVDKGQPLGTPVYMAPELIRGADATPASDLYSLGCTLFELASGAPPFRAPSIHSLFDLHTDAAVPSLKRGDLGNLSDVIAQLLAKQPEQRPASARAVRDALAPAGSARSRPRWLAAAVVVAVVVFGAAVGWLIAGRSAGADDRAAVAQPADAAPPRVVTQPDRAHRVAIPGPHVHEPPVAPSGPVDAGPAGRDSMMRRRRPQREHSARRPQATRRQPEHTVATPVVADRDKDGVADTVDACPDLWAENARGCPAHGRRIDGMLEFRLGAATLIGASAHRLDRIAAVIKSNPGVTPVDVRGHAGQGEGSADRTRLSWQRAAVVKRALIKRGVAAGKIRTYGHGKALYSSPLADVVVGGRLPARLSAGQISRATLELERHLEHCLARLPRHHRALIARFAIRASGRAGAPIDVRGPPAAVAACARKKIRAFRFPRSRSDANKAVIEMADGD